MNKKNILFKELSDTVIGIAFKVHTRIGSALPEHVYHHSLEQELLSQGISHSSQQCHQVYYNDTNVGHFFSDIIVDNKIILELKSADKITQGHLSQLFTYLRVSRLHVGYVLNFGTRSLGFKRLIL
jgi:GxxExxY protein